MKITNFLMIILINLVMTGSLYSAIGCLDTSFHMQRNNKKFYDRLDSSLRSGIMTDENLNKYQTDHKEVHPVWCTCPCEKYKKTKKSGLCTECRHYGSLDRSSHQNKKEQEVYMPLLATIVKKNTHSSKMSLIRGVTSFAKTE